MKKIQLESIVFIAGMGVMVFELVGSRILAPYVGTTIMVWTVLIGVIMAFLSAGYWWGGKMADRKADYNYFAGLIVVAAILVGLTSLIKLPVIAFLEVHMGNFRWEALVASAILFGPGSFFMAAISPYAVRLHMTTIKESGQTVGRLYAISTIGSLVGTFLTGLFLVTVMSSTDILFALAALLIAASLLAYGNRWFKTRISLLVLVLILPIVSEKMDYFFIPLHFIHSAYLDMALQEGMYSVSDPMTGEVSSRPILQLNTSPTMIQSAMFPDAPDELVIPYTQMISVLQNFFRPDVNNELLIGGAAYSLPKDFLKKYPTSRIDVVEIDPMMTEVAKKYFYLKEDPRLGIFHEDGRTYLNRNQKKYDVIIVDAFRAYVPPFQLTTLETVQRIYDSLSDDGVVMINLVQSIEGDSGKFFRAEYATYSKIFPQLYVFRVFSPDPNEVQNLILVGTKSSQRLTVQSNNPEVQNYLKTLWDGSIAEDGIVLTDNFAPVSDYMLPASRELR